MVGLSLPLAATVVSTSSAGEEDAKTLFAEGRKLRDAGNCEGAVVVFRRALEILPEGLGSLRNIAECEEQLGKYAAARRSYWSLRTAVMQTSEPKYDGWDKYAQQAHARLALKVARLTVKLTGRGLERVQVTIDGKPLDPRLMGVELEREVGAHTVEAHYGGAAPILEKVTLLGGTNETVTLAIPSAQPSPGAPKNGPASPATRGTTEPQAASGVALRTAGFVALGVGALGTTGAVISIAVRGAALGDIEAACPGYDAGELCPRRVEGARDRGETSSVLANVFGGVAIAGIGAGVALIVIGSSQKPSGQSARVQVIPGIGGAQARLTLVF